MWFRTSLLMFAAGALLAGVPPAAAEPRACYCSKVNHGAPPMCGELLGLSNDTARLMMPPTVELSLAEMAECPRGAFRQPPQPFPGGSAENSPACPPPGNGAFGIAGSNTIGEKLMPLLVRGYAKKCGWQAHGDQCNGSLRLVAQDGGALTIRCESHGSKTAIPALVSGQADIGMRSFPIPKDEQRLFPYPMDVPRRETVLALDGVLLLVALGNPVATLSLDEAARIFAGEIRDWAEVGGPAGPISLHVRNEKSGTRETFDFRVMEPYGRKVAAEAKRHESSTELVNEVAADPRAIGFVGFAYGNSTVKSLNIRATCGIIHKPSVFNIKTEDYPLARRLFLYRSREAHSPHSQHFVDYTVSGAAQAVIKDAGYIGQDIERLSQEETLRRLKEYGTNPSRELGLEVDPALLQKLAGVAGHAQRLSISFRFRTNESVLDTKAWQDVVRLAHYLQQEEPKGRVLLLGFADAVGGWDHNLALSRRRAEEVRAQLLRAATGLDPARLELGAMSELLPVSCNARAEEREKNRRVEVWLLDPGFVRGSLVTSAAAGRPGRR